MKVWELIVVCMAVLSFLVAILAAGIWILLGHV